MLHRHPFLSFVTGSYLLFVAWLTLTPQADRVREAMLAQRVLDALHRRGYAESIDYQRFEFLANIALFVPIGAFLLLLLGVRYWWLAGVVSIAATSAIEALQTQVPGRVPDERDLAANTMGAAIGIVIALILTVPGTVRRWRADETGVRASPSGR